MRIRLCIFALLPILGCLIVLPGQGWAQRAGLGFGTLDTITTAAPTTVALRTAQVNDDTLTDIVAAIQGDNAIAWFEHLGQGNFAGKQTAVTGTDSVTALVASDLDNDGDADIAYTAANGNKVAWLENRDTAGFSNAQTLTDTAAGASDLEAADLDGDGDPDLAYTAPGDGKLAWLENLDAGGFSAPKVIDNRGPGAAKPLQVLTAAELTGDTLTDLYVANSSGGGGTNQWLYPKSDSAAGFEPRQGISDRSTSLVTTADVDQDGDQDLLYEDNSKIAWVENDSFSFPTGGAQVELVQNKEVPKDVHVADVNGDGWPDLAAAATGQPAGFGPKASHLRFYPNQDSAVFDTVANFYGDGNPTGPIGAPQTGRAVRFADVEADGDVDILTAYDDVIAYAPNLTILDRPTTQRHRAAPLRLAPNPTAGALQLHAPALQAGQPYQLTVRDLSGRTLRQEQRTQQTLRLDVQPGVYLLRIQQGEYRAQRKVVVR